VIDKTRHEAEAIEYAALVAGQIVTEQVTNGVGSDLARWTPEAYHALIESAITAFVERLQELKGTE
jgi:hypothetical protein